VTSRNERRLAGLIGAILIVLVGIGLSKVSINAGVDSFVPPGDRTMAETDRVAESFGGDPIVVLLETKKAGDLLSSVNVPALVRLEGRLAALDNVATVYGPGTILNQIAGQAQDLLAELVGERDAARARGGEAAVQEFDDRYVPLLGLGIPGGLPTLRNEDFIRNVVFDKAGEPRPQWNFVVPNDSAVAILVRPNPGLRQDEVQRLVKQVESTVAKREVKDASARVSGVPTIVAALGERIHRDALVLGGLALLGVGAWFLFSPWTSRRRRLLPLGVSLAGTALTLAAAGWSGVSMSLGVVAFLPVLLGVGSDFMIYLISRVSRRLVVVAAMATSASFGALIGTPISAVRQLGWTLSIGVLVTLVVSLLVTRLFLSDDEPSEPLAESAVETRPVPARRIRVLAAVGAALVATIGWAALPHLGLDANFRTLAQHLPAYGDARHVQEVMGSSGEVAIALSGKDVMSPQSFAWMRKAEAKIITEHGDEVRPILSPPSLFQFLGPAPSESQIKAALRLLPSYLTSSVIRSDRQMAVMSFGVDIEDAVELGHLRDDIRAGLPPVPPGTTVRLVGLPLVAVSSYDSLSGNRFVNAGLGIVAAGLVLAIGLARRRDALLAVGSATLTTGFIMLAMYLFHVGLNPITAAVGSLAAAVACEFTVVLADAERRGHSHRSVRLAAAASATGYLVLAASGVASIRSFGLLLAVTVIVAAATAQFVVWVAGVRSQAGEA
jgi:predicted RND superfamily exporter protein